MYLFQISGPEFLLWYMAFFALSCLVAFVMRAVILQVSPDDVGDGEIDRYDIAYLSGGREQVYFTAIGTLSRLGVVTLDAVTRQLQVHDHKNHQLHPVEVDLCASIRWGDGKVETAYRQFTVAVERIEQRLQRLSLVPSESRTAAAQFVPALILAALPIFIGLPRLCHGMVEKHPTSFLIVLLIVSGLTTVFAALNKPHRTSLGADAVRILQGEHEALKLNFQTSPSSLSTIDTTLAYALFGGLIVGSADPFNLAKTALHPASTGSGGSGCGGGGCGGCGGGCGG